MKTNITIRNYFTHLFKVQKSVSFSFLVIIMCLLAVSINAQTTLYTQNFDNGGYFPSGWSASTGGGTLYTMSTVSPSTTATGNYNVSNGSNGYTLTFNGISTTNTFNITVTWRQRITSSGTYPSFYWSTDGSTWNSIVYNDVSSYSNWELINSITLPSGAENQSNLQFKWTSSGNATYYRMDDFTVQTNTGAGNWSLTGNNNATSSSFIGTTNAQDLLFKANTGTMTLLQNGNVGIGMTPTHKLEVAGDVQTNNHILYIRNSHHGLGWFGVEASPGTLNQPFAGYSVDGPVLFGWGGGALGIKNDDAYPTSPHEKIALRWNADGNVGIGTDEPEARLHVKLVSNTNAYVYGQKIEVTNSSTAANKVYGQFIEVSDGITADVYGVYALAYEGAKTVGVHGGGEFAGIEGTTNSGFGIRATALLGTAGYFKSDGLGIIVEKGNVLIGKTTQTNTNFNLDVSGIIHACEINVNVDGGCDYVFDNKYNLMPLKELENYLTSNKHLPEIAPAAEMVENGIDISKTQLQLLKKVEELTLYVIEQNKKLETLQKENEEMKKAIYQK